MVDRNNRNVLDRDLDQYMRKSQRFNKDQLDQDIDQYMSRSKHYLDQSIDQYMKDAKKFRRIKLQNPAAKVNGKWSRVTSDFPSVKPRLA